MSKHPAILVPSCLHIFREFSDEQGKVVTHWNKVFTPFTSALKKNNQTNQQNQKPNNSTKLVKKHLKKWDQESYHYKQYYFLCFSSVHCHTNCKTVFISFLDKYKRGSYQFHPVQASAPTLFDFISCITFLQFLLDLIFTFVPCQKTIKNLFNLWCGQKKTLDVSDIQS